MYGFIYCWPTWLYLLSMPGVDRMTLIAINRCPVVKSGVLNELHAWRNVARTTSRVKPRRVEVSVVLTSLRIEIGGA